MTDRKTTGTTDPPSFGRTQKQLWIVKVSVSSMSYLSISHVLTDHRYDISVNYSFNTDLE